MNKKLIAILVLSVIMVYGCTASQLAFNKGVTELNKIDEKYGIGLKTPPETTEDIGKIVADLRNFKDKNEVESLDMLVDFRIKFLESHKMFLEGWQWGRASTTEFGFGCNKGYARITESASLRNASANVGFEAVNLLQNFIDSYPKEAKSIDISQKDVLFLKATYFQEEEKALRDAKLIRRACKEQAAG